MSRKDFYTVSIVYKVDFTTRVGQGKIRNSLTLKSFLIKNKVSTV